MINGRCRCLKLQSNKSVAPPPNLHDWLSQSYGIHLNIPNDHKLNTTAVFFYFYFFITINEFHFGPASGKEITHFSFMENQVKALE